MDVKHQIEKGWVVGMLGLLMLVQTSSIAAEKRDSGMKNDQGFIVPTGTRQLFLDDYGIAKLENLKRTMHQPTKKGAVIRGPQTRSAPAWDTEANKYYFSTLGGVFESKDGLHWVQASGRMTRLSDCVIFDATEKDASMRYKGILQANGGAFGILLGPGVTGSISGDDAAFRKLADPTIESGDEYNLSFDPVDHLFILTVKHFDHGRAVALSTSKDFQHWTKPEIIFHADDLDQELGRKRIERTYRDPALQHPIYNMPAKYSVDVYNMGVFRYDGLYVGMPSMFHQTGRVAKDWPGFVDGFDTPEMLAIYRRDGDWSGFHYVELVCSRDLRQWQRLGDRQAFLAPSPMGAGAYDTATIIGPSFPILRGDELWFYYTGIKQYGGPELERGSAAICLAVLRRDGFISLDAAAKEGTILTNPFRVTGGKLFVNADARKGELRVQALDENGKVLASSAPLKGDLLRGEVQWQGWELASVKGRPTSLRFTLSNASFYSYWVEDNPPQKP